MNTLTHFNTPYIYSTPYSVKRPVWTTEQAAVHIIVFCLKPTLSFRETLLSNNHRFSCVVKITKNLLAAAAEPATLLKFKVEQSLSQGVAAEETVKSCCPDPHWHVRWKLAQAWWKKSSSVKFAEAIFRRRTEATCMPLIHTLLVPPECACNPWYATALSFPEG